MIKGSATTKPQAFTAAVKWVAKFLASRPAVPAQGGLLLDIEGGRLSILGYNENLTARAVVEVEGDANGQAVVSGRLLAELAGTFGNRSVVIEGADGWESVTLTVGSWRGTLPVIGEESFPSPPSPPPVVGRVLGSELTGMIRRVAVARADNDKAALRWHLTHLSFGEHEIAAMATDSYRGARETIRFESEAWIAGRTALVHSATMLDVAEAFDGPDEVWIGLDSGSIGLASPTRAVIMRQTVDQEYPTEQIAGLFRGKNPEHAQVSAKELLTPLKRAVIMREGKDPVNVRFGPALIALAAESATERRAGEEEVVARYSGPEWTLRFNPGYFADALASAPGETIDIELSTEKITGVVITVPGNETWRHLLMPIRK